MKKSLFLLLPLVLCTGCQTRPSSSRDLMMENARHIFDEGTFKKGGKAVVIVGASSNIPSPGDQIPIVKLIWLEQGGDGRIEMNFPDGGTAVAMTSPGRYETLEIRIYSDGLYRGFSFLYRASFEIGPGDVVYLGNLTAHPGPGADAELYWARLSDASISIEDKRATNKDVIDEIEARTGKRAETRLMNWKELPKWKGN